MTRKVLITGATRGIGCEVTKQLCALDFQVFATGRDQDRLKSLQDETGCLGTVCDLSDAAAVSELYAQAKHTLGRIDVLVNNAGFNPGKDSVEAVTLEQMDASYAINFRAPFLLAQAALQDMKAAGQGHILIVVSTIARTSMENYST